MTVTRKDSYRDNQNAGNQLQVLTSTLNVSALH